MLDSYKNRFAHAFCFCVSVSRISNVILGDTRAVLGPGIYNEVSAWPPWLNCEYLEYLFFNTRTILLF